LKKILLWKIITSGAADFSAEDGVFEIQTEPDDFSAVRDALEEKGYTFVSAEVEMVPSTYTKLTDEEAITKMQRLLDVLEDNDDVQNVFHNWEYDEPEEDE
jgi:transcriptional/translational regulatory protein YebC/TACO1